MSDNAIHCLKYALQASGKRTAGGGADFFLGFFIVRPACIPEIEDRNLKRGSSRGIGCARPCGAQLCIVPDEALKIQQLRWPPMGYRKVSLLVSGLSSSQPIFRA